MVKLATICLLIFTDSFAVPNAPLAALWQEMRVEACPTRTGSDIRVLGRLYQEIEAREGTERFYLQDGAWKLMASHLAHATTTQGLQ